VEPDARNSEIARRLGALGQDRRNHISTILIKLDTPDRTAAALKARDAGLTPPVDIAGVKP